MKKLIVSEIYAAFRGVELGNGIGLREAQVLDERGSMDQRIQARAIDEKADWSRITPGELTNEISSLSFFDSLGMRFHLPAFLVAELDGLIDASLDFHLTNVVGRHKDRFGLFTKPQKLAVAAALRYMRLDPRWCHNHQEISRALREFWVINNIERA